MDDTNQNSAKFKLLSEINNIIHEPDPTRYLGIHYMGIWFSLFAVGCNNAYSFLRFAFASIF